MRFLHLTPGTGSFHCGSCLRDHALIRALRFRKHDAVMAPLYLPLVTDREFSAQEPAVQVGGVSLYLQQKMPWFHHMPGFIHRWLNKPEKLRKASRRIGMTSSKALGEMTLDSLMGSEGRQWGEWKKLLTWVRGEGKFEVISLSNSLLSGLAPTMEKELGVPVICSLQGEDSFLDTLPDPYREQAWEAMRRNAASIRRFIAPSYYYADHMRKRLGLSAEQITVIPNGIDATSFTMATPDPNWPTIGYFARMIHGKGLTTLVDAFILLAQRGSVPRVKLRIGGAKTDSDEKYIQEQRRKLAAAGLEKRVEFRPNLSFKDKVHFFSDLTILSVPATYGEAFGLYVIEALASGVPVVQPRHGAFPEIIEKTGGGLLCEPDDVESLANALESLLLDADRCDQIAKTGLAGVRAHYSATQMAENFESMLRDVVS